MLDLLLTQQQKKYYDAHLLSFPRCGRTWLRLMIGWTFASYFNLTNSKNLEAILNLEKLSELDSRIPKIKVEHDDDALKKKTDQLTRTKAKYKYTKVIFLVRNPIDVVISSYFYKKKRSKLFPHIYRPYKGKISDFIHETVGSFGTLIEYYNIWAENRHIPRDFLLVTYENLSTQTHQEMRRIIDFLNVKILATSILIVLSNLHLLKICIKWRKNSILNRSS